MLSAEPSPKLKTYMKFELHCTAILQYDIILHFPTSRVWSDWYPRKLCSSFPDWRRYESATWDQEENADMTFHLWSPFTDVSIYLIACEAGSVSQEGDCLREIVIFLRSGNVGAEDQFSDALFLVSTQTCWGAFAASGKWGERLCHPFLLDLWHSPYFCVSFWVEVVKKEGLLPAAQVQRARPSGGLLREHSMKGKSPALFLKAVSLGAAGEWCWHSSWLNLVELSSSLISVPWGKSWFGSLHRAIFPAGSAYTISLVPSLIFTRGCG